MKMRWKADLPKIPRLPKIPLEPGEPPQALGPPPAPRAYREKNPYESQPVEYQAPSMLVEHRGLALLFLAASLAFAVYCLSPPRRAAALAERDAHGAAKTSAGSHTAATAPPPQAEAPIYVEALPDKNP